MSNYFSLQPGEEKMFVMPQYWGTPDPGTGNRRFVVFMDSGSPSCGTGCFPYGSAQSLCKPGSDSAYFAVKDFGFEYQVRVEGQTLTKRQVGKPVVIKCGVAATGCGG